MSDIIKISKEYQGLWLGQEITVNPDQDKKEQWRKAEAEMDSYFHSRGQTAMTDYNTGQQAKIAMALHPSADVNAVQRLITIINDCTTTEELEQHYADAEKFNVTPTWDKKLKSLQNLQQ